MHPHPYRRTRFLKSSLAAVGLNLALALWGGWGGGTAFAQTYTGFHLVVGQCGPVQNSAIPVSCGTEQRESLGNCASSCVTFPTPVPGSSNRAFWNRRTAPGLLEALGRVDATLFAAPCGSTGGGQVSMNQTLTANDLIFFVRDNPGQPGSVSATFNVEFGGRVSGGPGACGRTSQVYACAGLGACNISGTLSAFGASSGALASYANDDTSATITSGLIGLSLNSPSGFYMQLDITASGSHCVGGNTAAATFFDAHATLSLPTTGPVFNLPPGITCRSAQLRIVDNQWMGPCPADINCSGGLSVQDIFDFLAFYFAGDPRGDFNNSGLPATVQDIFDFLAAYFAGC